MTNSVINKNNNIHTSTTRDIKEFLMSGDANVDFINNGTGDMVYTVEGVEGLEVSANGYIIDKGVVKYPKQSNDTVYIGHRKEWSAINISFKSLVTLLNGYIPKGGLVLSCKNSKDGFAPHNLQLVNKFNGDVEPLSILKPVGTLEYKGVEPSQEEIPLEPELLNSDDLYTRKETTTEYLTEDGSVFKTLEAAAIHQRDVTEAKEIANVVLEYNKELFGIAEKAFLQAIHYIDSKKPYVNFIDVMSNNDGVVERQSKEVVKFNSFTIGGDPKWAYLFSDKSYSQETADEIVGMLSLAQEVFANLEALSHRNV